MPLPICVSSMCLMRCPKFLNVNPQPLNLQTFNINTAISGTAGQRWKCNISVSLEVSLVVRRLLLLVQCIINQFLDAMGHCLLSWQFIFASFANHRHNFNPWAFCLKSIGEKEKMYIFWNHWAFQRVSAHNMRLCVGERMYVYVYTTLLSTRDATTRFQCNSAEGSTNWTRLFIYHLDV